MKAVILAAGIASRLRPLTDNTPKCLLKAGTKSILALTLDNIIANSISEIVIVTGYLEKQIRDFVSSNYAGLHVEYIFNEDYASTNNIYSLWLAKESVLGNEMLLLDSDIVFDRRIIAKLISSGFENCLALKRHKVGVEEIKVRADSSGKILEISKEVTPAEALGESVGIEKFEKRFVEDLYQVLDKKIEQKDVNIFYEAAFQELVNAGKNIFSVDITEYPCMEIDTADDLSAAGKLLAGASVSV